MLVLVSSVAIAMAAKAVWKESVESVQGMVFDEKGHLPSAVHLRWQKEWGIASAGCPVPSHLANSAEIWRSQQALQHRSEAQRSQ
jgi:hypothetical protein